MLGALKPSATAYLEQSINHYVWLLARGTPVKLACAIVARVPAKGAKVGRLTIALPASNRLRDRYVDILDSRVAAACDLGAGGPEGDRIGAGRGADSGNAGL